MTFRIMSDGELTRLEVLRDLDQRRLTTETACQLLRLSRRQLFRVLGAYRPLRDVGASRPAATRLPTPVPFLTCGRSVISKLRGHDGLAAGAGDQGETREPRSLGGGCRPTDFHRSRGAEGGSSSKTREAPISRRSIYWHSMERRQDRVSAMT